MDMEKVQQVFEKEIISLGGSSSKYGAESKNYKKVS